MARVAELTPSQREFVFADPARPVIGEFPAGGGKTRSLVERAIYLAGQVPRDRGVILTTTYTRRAACEIEGRVAARVGDGAAGRIWARTLHSAGLWLLTGPPRLAQRYLGFPGDRRIRVAGDWEQERAALSAARMLRLDAPARALVRDIGLQKVGALPRDTGLPVDAVARLRAEYDRVLHGRGLIDHDDMVVLPYLAMRDHREALREARGVVARVLIDEAQDLTHADFLLASALGGNAGERLGAVFDARQCINRWRGSDERYVLRMVARLPGVRLVRISETHRLTRPNAAVANRVGRAIMGERDTPMVAARDGPPPVLYLGADKAAEAEYVGKTARALLDAGIVARPADIAVLYRQRHQLLGLRDALDRYRVPLRDVRAERLDAQPVVRAALAWLKLHANPSDTVALGELTGLARAFAAAGGVWSVYRLARELPPGATDRQKARASEVLDIQATFGRPGRRDAGEDFDAVIAAARVADQHRGTARWPAVERALGLLRSAYVAAVGDVGYLERLIADDLAGEPTGVTLVTMHAAKGNEFPVVFVTGFNGDDMPYWRSVREDGREGRRSEAMVLFVALTRAVEELHIVGSLDRPTPFLATIPRDGVRLVVAA